MVGRMNTLSLNPDGDIIDSPNFLRGNLWCAENSVLESFVCLS